MTIAPALARLITPVIQAGVGGDSILDVGSGGGLVATSIALGDRRTVVGIDPSGSQVRRMWRQARHDPQVWPVRGRAESLPFGEDSFDSVYSSCAWKHWPDPAVGLAECVRVTRPGGALLVIEIDGASTIEEFRRFAREARIPFGLRDAYVRFAMRTVVGVAPDLTALTKSFEGLSVCLPVVTRMGELPFLVASTIVL
ncbi:MAG TPA: class I SAM-dependent methyltransferase [Acidimicrobiales bacterium]